MSTQKNTLATIIILCILLLAPLPTFAIGISPARFEEIIPAGESRKMIINIVRGHPDREDGAELRFEGSVARFISIPQGARVTLPRGQQLTPVPFLITLPKDAKGTYEGTLQVPVGLASPSGGSGVQMSLQATIQVIVGQPPETAVPAVSPPPPTSPPPPLPSNRTPAIIGLVMFVAVALAGWQWRKGKKKTS